MNHPVADAFVFVVVVSKQTNYVSDIFVLRAHEFRGRNVPTYLADCTKHSLSEGRRTFGPAGLPGRNYMWLNKTNANCKCYVKRALFLCSIVMPRIYARICLSHWLL